MENFEPTGKGNLDDSFSNFSFRDFLSNPIGTISTAVNNVINTSPADLAKKIIADAQAKVQAAKQVASNILQTQSQLLSAHSLAQARLVIAQRKQNNLTAQQAAAQQQALAAQQAAQAQVVAQQALAAQQAAAQAQQALITAQQQAQAQQYGQGYPPTYGSPNGYPSGYPDPNAGYPNPSQGGYPDPNAGYPDPSQGGYPDPFGGNQFNFSGGGTAFEPTLKLDL